MSLCTVATIFHDAPPAGVIFRGIKKHPSTALALADLIAAFGNQEIAGRPDNWPKDLIEARFIEPPCPQECVMCPCQVQLLQRKGKVRVQDGHLPGGGSAGPGNRSYDHVQRLPKVDRSGNYAICHDGMPVRKFDKQLTSWGGNRSCEHGPVKEVGVVAEPFMGTVGFPPADCIHEIERQVAADEPVRSAIGSRIERRSPSV